MSTIERTQLETDHLTGEITRHSSTVVQLNKLPPEPEYIKLYIQDLGRLKGLQPSHREILVYVAACVGYDGIITLTARRRLSIAFTVGCNQRTVDNAISEYVKTGIIRRVGRGEYELNPFLFAKGDWNSIRQRREAFVSSVAYDPNLGRVPVETRPLSSDEKERIQAEKCLNNSIL